jgi:hypothetical protein
MSRPFERHLRLFWGTVPVFSWKNSVEPRSTSVGVENRTLAFLNTVMWEKFTRFKVTNYRMEGTNSSRCILWSACRYIPGSVAPGDEARLWCEGQRPLRHGVALPPQQDCSSIHDFASEYRSGWWQHCRGGGRSSRWEGSEGWRFQGRLCAESTQRRAPSEAEVSRGEGFQHQVHLFGAYCVGWCSEYKLATHLSGKCMGKWWKISTVSSNVLTYLLTHSLHGAWYYLKSWLSLSFSKNILSYGTRRFITVFIQARHWTISWASWIQCIR